MQNFNAESNQNYIPEAPASNDFATLNFGRIDQNISTNQQYYRPQESFSPFLPPVQIDYNFQPQQNPAVHNIYPPGYWDNYWRNYFIQYYGNQRQNSYYNSPYHRGNQPYEQPYERPNQRQYDRPERPNERPYEQPNRMRRRPEDFSQQSELNFSLKGKTIALVPGHGGHDHGNTEGGTQEKKTALEISLRLKTTLERLGAKVIITREDDVLVSPGNQKSFVERNRPDVAIAIHTDSAGSREFGNMTLWGLPISREFAETMQSVLSQVTESNRPVKQQTRTWNGGRLAIVHAQDVPTILLETANMKNNTDAQRIQTADYQQKLVDGIAQGVFNYFNRSQRQAQR